MIGVMLVVVRIIIVLKIICVDRVFFGFVMEVFDYFSRSRLWLVCKCCIDWLELNSSKVLLVFSWILFMCDWIM